MMQLEVSAAEREYDKLNFTSERAILQQSIHFITPIDQLSCGSIFKSTVYIFRINLS